jgi:hypothetical protein
VCVFIFFFLPESEFKAGKSGITPWIYRYNILLPVHVKPTWARYTTLSTVGAAAVFVWFFLPFFRLLILVFSPLLCTYFTTSCCAQTGRVRGPAPSDAIIVLFRVLRFFHTVCIRLSLESSLLYTFHFSFKKRKINKKTPIILYYLFFLSCYPLFQCLFIISRRADHSKKKNWPKEEGGGCHVDSPSSIDNSHSLFFFLRFFLLWT